MHLDRTRAALAAAELDGLVLLTPRHVLYATGYRPWFLSMYAEAGYAAALIPADRGQPPAALVSDVEEMVFRATAPDFPHVVTYPAWVAYAAVPPLADDAPLTLLAAETPAGPGERAGTIDREAALAKVAELCRAVGLDRGRLGIEMSFLSARDAARLTAALPKATFHDATDLVAELRAIKSDGEVALLRRGTRLAEQAVGDVAAAVRVGMTAGEIAARYRASVMTQADGGDVTGARLTLRVGPDVLHPAAATSHALRRGDVLFLDCGVEVGGYWADIGRTFVAGSASSTQRRIYGALREGFDAAIANLQRGRAVAAAFDAGLAAARDAGLSRYVRGNLGHGVGLHPAPELPIISREEPRLVTPGHVISVEVPYYLDGIGAFTLEDTVAVTGEGREVFNQLSRDLVELEL